MVLHLIFNNLLFSQECKQFLNGVDDTQKSTLISSLLKWKNIARRNDIKNHQRYLNTTLIYLFFYSLLASINPLKLGLHPHSLSHKTTLLFLYIGIRSFSCIQWENAQVHIQLRFFRVLVFSSLEVLVVFNPYAKMLLEKRVKYIKIYL